MAQPRRWSRSDRLTGRQRWHRRAPSVRAGSVRNSAAIPGDQVDPGRVIETAFRSDCCADEPETYVLAWLAILPPSVGAPRAAALLSARLQRLRVGKPSSAQRRLIELLDFVAMHRRRTDAGPIPICNPTPKKGMS
jgi:hypothetical protein